MPPCGWRHYTQARSCLGRVDPGPEPSLSQAGNEGPAWRREEAPSRASPAGNQLTRQKGKPQPQGEESPNRLSPRKLFSAGEGHPPTRRRRAGLSRDVAFQRKLPDYEPIIYSQLPVAMPRNPSLAPYAHGEPMLSGVPSVWSTVAFQRPHLHKREPERA